MEDEAIMISSQDGETVDHDIRERLVARRAGPIVLFLDRSMQLRAASGHGVELWNRFGHAVVTLLCVNEPALKTNAVATVTPDGSHSLQLVRLGDEAGFAILLEPFKSRDPMRDVSERYSLTPRERDVARLLVEGASTPEIAEALSIAISTAIIHVKSVMAKTGSRTRAAAVGRMVHHDGDGYTKR